MERGLVVVDDKPPVKLPAIRAGPLLKPLDEGFCQDHQDVILIVILEEFGTEDRRVVLTVSLDMIFVGSRKTEQVVAIPVVIMEQDGADRWHLPIPILGFENEPRPVRL